jgi:uncharacterized protein YaiE (UPF0345 family)
MGTHGNFQTNGSHNLIFSPGLTESVRFTATGNVGIGITNPSHRLHISGNLTATGYLYGAGSYIHQYGPGASANDIRFVNWSGSELARFTDSGNIGIGTTSPTHLLSLSSPNVSDLLQLHIEGSSGAGLIRFTNNTGTLGRIVALAGTGLRFDTGSTERLRIDALGNIGIGTTNPLEKLDLSGRLRLSQMTPPDVTADRLYNVEGNLFWDGVQITGLAGGDLPAGTLTGQTLYWTGGSWSANNTLFNTGTNVGIGTTSPQFSLHVKSAGSMDGIYLANSSGHNIVNLRESVGGNGVLEIRDNTGAIRHYFNAGGNSYLGAGNFGIGTTNPQTRLEVDGAGHFSSIANPGLSIGDGTTGYLKIGSSTLFKTDGNALTVTGSFLAQGAYYSISNNAGLANIMHFQNSASPTNGSGSALNFYQRTSTNNMVLTSRMGGLISDANPDAYKGALVLYTSNNSAPVEQVRLDHIGRLGIGTTAPAARLDIVSGGLGILLGGDNNTLTRTDGTSKVARIMAPHRNAADSPLTLLFSTGSVVNMGGGTSVGNAATDIRFYTATNDTTSTGTERLRINSLGNVGIGTSNPISTLDVNGTARISGHTQLYDSLYLNTGVPIVNMAGGTSPRIFLNPTSIDLRANATDTALFIDATGNIGIGTTNPLSRLALKSAGPDTSGLSLIKSDSSQILFNLTETPAGNAQFLMYPHFGGNATISLHAYGSSYINTGHNLGIGTTSPQEKLDLAGRIRIAQTTAPADTSDRLYNVSGQLFWNGAQLTGLAGGNLPAGTLSGETLAWNGSAWTASNLLFNTGTNVGIGTTNPTYKLQVAGGADVVGTLSFNQGTAGIVTWDPASFIVRGGTGKSLSLGANGVIDRLHITTAGNIGIGTTSPTQRLEINGNTSTSRLFVRDSTALNPGLVITGDRANILLHTTDVSGGVAFDFVRAQVTNTDEATTLFGKVGFFGTANVGGNPYAHYMYIDSRPDAAWNSATLKIDSTNRIGIAIPSTDRPLRALSIVDPGVGFDRPGTNVLGMYTNNLERLRIDASGNVAIGTTDPRESRLRVHASYTDTTSVVDSVLFRSSFTANTAANTQINRGIYSVVDTHGAQNFTGSIHAFNGEAFHYGSGTVSTMTGLTFAGGAMAEGNITNLNLARISTYSTGGTGTIGTVKGLSIGDLGLHNSPTNMYGIDIDANTSAGGTNKMGIRIGDISGATNNYSIYSAGGKSYFAGNIGIGTTSPQEKLDLGGRLRLAQTTAPADTSDRLYNVSGQLFWNGAQLTGLAGGNLPAGTLSGETLAWNGSAWTASNLLFNTGTNIGIGTTSPGAKLDITPSEDAAILQSTGYSVTGSGSAPMINLSGTWNTTGAPTLIKADVIGTAWATNSRLLDLHVSGVSQMNVTPFGDINIRRNFTLGGIINQTSNHVVGLIANTYTPTMRQEGADQQVIAARFIPIYNQPLATGVKNTDLLINRTETNLGTTPGDQFLIDAQVNGISKFAITNTGNIGIGTTNTHQKLNLNGSMFIHPGHSIYWDVTSNQTGIRGSANNLIFTVGGSERMFVDSIGNIGIGTTSPTSRLEIVGQSDIVQNLIKGHSTQTNHLTEWRNSGHSLLAAISGAGHWGLGVAPSSTVRLAVGVSYTNPSTTTESIRNTQVLHFTENNIYQGRASSNYLYLDVANGINANGQQSSVLSSLYIRHSNQGTINIANAGWFYTGIEAGAAGTVDTMNIYKAGVFAAGANTVAFNHWRGYSVDALSPASLNGATINNLYGLHIGALTAGTNNFAIFTDGNTKTYFGGNVGIGTTDPNSILTLSKGVTGSLGPTLRLENRSGGVGAAAHIDFGTTGSAVAATGRIGAIRSDSAFTGDTDIFISTQYNSVLSEKLRVTSDGNIGIGTTAPSQKLDVVGNLAFSGSLMPAGEAGSAGQFLISQGSGAAPVWTSTIPATSMKWNDLTSPDGDLNLAMGTHSTTFDWATGTGTNNLFSLISANAANGTGSLLNIATGTSSSISPLRVRAGTTESLFVSSTGNVGIGTTAPSQKLDVNGNVQLAGGGGDHNFIRIGYGDDPNRGTVVQSGYYLSGNLNYQSIFAHNAMLQQSGSSSVYEKLRSDLTAYGLRMSHHDGGFDFFSLTGSSAPYTHNSLVRISAAGNVGIGTTNPTVKLDVSGGMGRFSDASGRTIQIGSDNASLLAHIGTTTSHNFSIVTNNAPVARYFSGGGLSLGSTYYSSAAPTDGLLVEGNVGIGTTNPREKLEVNGNVRLGGSTSNIIYALGQFSGNVWFRDNPTIRTSAESNLTFNIGVGHTPDYIFQANASEIMRITGLGNVGIGTTNPQEKLVIDGRLLVTQSSAPGTTADRLYNVGGNLFWNGAQLTGLAGGNLPAGALTGETLYWDGSAWTTTQNLFFDSTSSRIGIGTTSPDKPLHVYLDQNGAYAAHIENASAIGGSGLLVSAGSGIAQKWERVGQSSFLELSFPSNRTTFNSFSDIVFQTSDTEIMRVKSTGNVGIGTTHPEFKLDIAGGHVIIDNNYYYKSASTDGLQRSLIGIDNNNILQLGPQEASHAIAFRQGASEAMRIASGNLGVGTTNPEAKLHISGGSILLDNAQWLSAKDFSGTARQILSMAANDYIALGNTINRLILRGNATGITLGEVGTNPTNIQRTNLSTALAPTANSNQFRLTGSYWNGSTELTLNPYLYTRVTSTDPSYYLGLNVGNADRLVINQLGYVGIGTTNPTTQFHLYGGRAYIQNTQGGTVDDVFKIDTDYGQIFKIGKPGATLGHPNYITTTDHFLYGSLSVNTDKLYVTGSTGNIGIGTTNPSQKFEVNGNAILSGADPTLYFADTNNYIQLNSTNLIARTTGSTYFRTGGNIDRLQLLSTGDINLVNGATNLITVKSTGNIGIGTTDPAYKFSIVGNVNSQIYLNNPLEGAGGGTIGSASRTNLALYGGAKYTGAYNALATSASGLNFYNGQVFLFTDIGLTAGNTFTPTQRLHIAANGDFSFNQNQVFFQSSFGNVGIGTTDPTSKLSIAGGDLALDNNKQILWGTGATQSTLKVNSGILQFFYSGNEELEINVNSTSATTITSKQAQADLRLETSGTSKHISLMPTGNVGIGTTSPSSMLEISKHDNTVSFGNSPIALTLRNTETTNSVGSRGYTGINFSSLNETTTGTYAGIYGVVTGSNSTGQIGSIIFGTKALVGDSSLTERMTITNTGNVGIGTTDPGIYKLYVNGSGFFNGNVIGGGSHGIVWAGRTIMKSPVDGQVTFLNNASDDFNRLNFGGTTSSFPALKRNGAGLDLRLADDSNWGNLQAGNAIFNGNVGIGTTNPQAKLDVAGMIKLNNELIFTGQNPVIRNDFGVGSDLRLITGDYTLSLDENKLDSSTGTLYLQPLTGGGVYIGDIDSAGSLHIADGNGIYKIRMTGSSGQATFDGNVGIGTTDPSEKLSVVGSINISGEGSLKLAGTTRIDKDGLFYLADGNETIPGLRFENDADTGIFRPGTDTIAFTTGGTERLRINADGNVGIGTTNPSSRLTVLGIQSGTGTNLVIDEDGNIYQASSSERFKDNISDLETNFSQILELTPKTFTYKITGHQDIGYMAEDLDQLGLKDLVNYDQQGLPLSIKYDRITLYTVELVKQQKSQIEQFIDHQTITNEVLIDEIASLSAQLEQLQLLLSTSAPTTSETTLSSDPVIISEPADFSDFTDPVDLNELPADAFDTSESEIASLSAALTLGQLLIYNPEASTSAIPTLETPDVLFAALFDNRIQFMNNTITIDIDGNLILKTGVIYGNHQMRGIEVAEQGNDRIVVRRDWTVPPYAITVTPQFDSHVWVENINPLGFVIRIKNPPTKGNHQVTWIAIW